LTVKSGDYRLSLLVSHLEPRRLWRSLGEPGGRRGSKLDQNRNCALRFSSGRRARERRGGRRDFLIVALVGCCAHCQECRTRRQRGSRGQWRGGRVRSGWRRLAADMACGRTGRGCQGTQHCSGGQEQSRDQDAGESRKALATRGILVARQVRTAPRANPAAGDLGMANADGRAATATGDDHGFHGQSWLTSLSEGIRRRRLIKSSTVLGLRKAGRPDCGRAWPAR